MLRLFGWSRRPTGYLWANEFLTNSIITMAALAVLENTLNATKSINRELIFQLS
jgi:hypothetical protein